MSSNIKVQRICQHCGAEFTARTTVTKCCSDKCSKALYKARIRAEKVQKSNSETQQIKTKPIEVIQVKEFLTVREVATLLNCSVRSIYYYIESGTIRATNLGQRITRVKRSEIDKLFEQPKTEQHKAEVMQSEITDCYTINEVLGKFSISETALQNLIKRKNIPKIKKGLYTYVPQLIIDNLLS
ncbi:helix-turn-helix domain-containing protein [Flavobacterium sp. CBA20B-1]|uniref:helix-turn-helix domain-containing protein n=1 Tax=unclassified Flavobacterium TaxID=196869 RepID=UPI002224F5C2|nr:MULTISPECIES: helix-turn-helix domain-containing protein [unclassified Flavobacterium]WCM42694.1 helix-turn-helix domain-containing protein [Flavobacterium sp. CBA20B-1]